MSKFIIRLDDACEKYLKDKWVRMEELLDKYGIKPLVGVIPKCEDPSMEQNGFDDDFWNRTIKWREKGWELALHGFNHVYSTECGGLNPVNKRSEFAGEPLDIQMSKIEQGVAVLAEHDIHPRVFFAPSHTFDENTITALKNKSEIRIISDTVAFDIYRKYDFTFVPQQSGTVRKLPFKVVTFCYHPNTMKDNDYAVLEEFIKKYQDSFIPFPVTDSAKRYTCFDSFLNYLYMRRHR